MTPTFPVEQFESHLGELSSVNQSVPATLEPERGPVSLRTVRDLRDLEGLREIWKSWSGSRDSDLDYFSHRVRWRGPDCRPHVIVLSRNEKPEAILIGFLERRSVPVRLGQVTVCRRMATVLEFVRGALRGEASAENCAALVRQVNHSLKEGEADTAVWENLPMESPFYTLIGGQHRLLLREYFSADDDRYVMPFPKTMDELWTSLHSTQRSKLRRKYQRVWRHFAGRIQIREFSSMADLEPALAAVEQIASQSDKRSLGFGFFDTAEVREGMALAARADWLRIYVLYLEDKPAAFWMGTLYNGCLQADHVAHDRVWAHFSPGTFLLLHIIDRLQRVAVSSVDLGRGRAQLKECLGALPQPEARVQIYASTGIGIQLKLLTLSAHRATVLWRSPYFPGWVRSLRTQLAPRRPNRPLSQTILTPSTDTPSSARPLPYFPFQP